MSVGNPGCGAVVTFTARSGPARRTLTFCPSLATSTPAARSLTMRASMSESSAPSMTTSLPSTIAAATMYVPASMRSGMMA